MARIRSIKPDFWTDEKIVELDFATRLFFIGSWNYADDNGNLQRSAKKLKMQIFPADAIDCEPLILELIAHGLFTEYSVSGEKYLHINNFRKHQVINRPSRSHIPSCEMPVDNSTLTEDSLTEGKGREGKGVNQTAASSGEGAPEDPPPRTAADPIQSRAIELTALLRQRGASLQASDPRVIAWAERGVSDAAALSALEVALSRRAEAGDPKPVNAGYLDSIIGGNGNGISTRKSAAERRADHLAELGGYGPGSRAIAGSAKRVG